MLSAQQCLAGRKSLPAEESLRLLSDLLFIHRKALELYRVCKGLQPQLGPLPGQSIGNHAGSQERKRIADGGDAYFDCLTNQVANLCSLEGLGQHALRLGKGPAASLQD